MTATPTAEPPWLRALVAGAFVEHPAYGPGRLEAIEGAGPDRKGVVMFLRDEPGRTRRFVLARSPLRALPRSPVRVRRFTYPKPSRPGA